MGGQAGSLGKEGNNLVQTEVAGHLRGHVARQGDGVDREYSTWEMTGTVFERVS